MERNESSAKLVLSFGQADVRWNDEAVDVDVRSDDDTGLAYMKLSIASHILEFLHKDETAPKIRWVGDGAAGELLPYFREMKVVSVSDVTPHMRRVRLQGSDLKRFSQHGLHIRLLFPQKALAQRQWPVMGEDGRPVWPEGEAQIVARVYTIRQLDADAGWVDIDMVIHGDDCDAPGSGWATSVKPGDIVGMTGPGGGDAAQDAKWYLLAIVRQKNRLFRAKLMLIFNGCIVTVRKRERPRFYKMLFRQSNCLKTKRIFMSGRDVSSMRSAPSAPICAKSAMCPRISN